MSGLIPSCAIVKVRFFLWARWGTVCTHENRRVYAQRRTMALFVHRESTETHGCWSERVGGCCNYYFSFFLFFLSCPRLCKPYEDEKEKGEREEGGGGRRRTRRRIKRGKRKRRSWRRNKRRRVDSGKMLRYFETKIYSSPRCMSFTILSQLRNE